MCRTWWAITLAALALPLEGRAADDSLRAALALQETFQAAIRQAEPSIACVLVARSDIYRRWFNQAPPADQPGKLGPFGPTIAPRLGPQDQQERNDYVKLLEKRLPAQRLLPRGGGRLVDHDLWMLFDLADPANVPDSYGSGVVLNDRGLVLTNFHVVQGAAKVYVRLPGGRGSYADIHAADPRSDLAVLKLLDASLRPPAIPMGDGGQARKGQLVLSLANPFAAGFRDGSPSASWGIISNLRRRGAAPVVTEGDRNRTQLHQFGSLIQTDARLNLGCSGGALLNLQGQLIGLTTSLAAITGTETAGGFAVPIDANMRKIIGVLERGEEVSYGFLGVSYPTQGRRDDLQLGRIVGGSPADRARLRPGDAIVAINGMEIRERDDLFLAIGSCLAGAEARIEIRNGDRSRRTVTAILDKLYCADKGIVSSKPSFVHGLRVDYTSILVQRDVLQECPPGVFVREVEAGGPAEKAHLHEAIVSHVNGESVKTPADFYRVAGKAAGTLELTILERPHTRTVKLD